MRQYLFATHAKYIRSTATPSPHWMLQSQALKEGGVDSSSAKAIAPRATVLRLLLRVIQRRNGFRFGTERQVQEKRLLSRLHTPGFYEQDKTGRDKRCMTLN